MITSLRVLRSRLALSPSWKRKPRPAAGAGFSALILPSQPRPSPHRPCGLGWHAVLTEAAEIIKQLHPGLLDPQIPVRCMPRRPGFPGAAGNIVSPFTKQQPLERWTATIGLLNSLCFVADCGLVWVWSAKVVDSKGAGISAKNRTRRYTRPHPGPSPLKKNWNTIKGPCQKSWSGEYVMQFYSHEKKMFCFSH